MTPRPPLSVAMSSKAQHLTKKERVVLQALREKQSLPKLSESLDIADIAILRAATYLSEEGLLAKFEEEERAFVVTEKGSPYVSDGLPEIQIYNALSSEGTRRTELLEHFTEDEVNAAIGQLKRAGAITTESENGLLLIPEAFDPSQYPPQKTLRQAPIASENADESVDDLVKRGLLDEDITTTLFFERTSDGDSVVTELSDMSFIDAVTPEVIANKTWQDKTFRSYRVTDYAEPARIGRKHFVKDAIDTVKDFWVSLGFQEMRGDHVHSAFWDLDALFVPQDHPARDLQDTFYLPYESDLPDEYVSKVRTMHEDGGSIDSDGWDIAFNTTTSSNTLLRTHTTVLSAQQFADLTRDDLPKKYFCVDKNYRNETIDWSHLMEFHQVEGIVVTEEASLARLISYLNEFFGAMGYDDIRLRPAYFPYTEPSAEVDAYNEERDEWLEIGGAGVIRPEVTKPLLGFACPVLAWGTGLERIITAYYNINDLRDLYSNDINDLQERRPYANPHA